MKRISFVGDLMFKEQMVPIYRENDGSFSFDCIFDKVKDFLQESDYTIGNLETTVFEDDGPIYSVDVNFNAPIEFLRSLKRAGFNYLATGNNHCLNRKVIGLKRTIENIEMVGFDHGGTNYDCNAEKKYSMIDIGGCRLAIFSYTYGTNTLKNKFFLDDDERGYVNLFQEQQYQNKKLLWMASNPFFAFRWLYRLYATFIKGEARWGEQSEHVEDNARCRKELCEQVQMAQKENPDYMIMLMHAGGRYHETPSPWVVELANYLQEIGFDMIIGHHEHRLQKCIVTYEPRFRMCAYDVGNFCSSTGVINGPFNRLSEYSVILNLYLDEKQIVNVSYVLCKSDLNSEGKVHIVPVSDILNHTESEEKRSLIEKRAKQALKILTGNDYESIEREIFVF